MRDKKNLFIILLFALVVVMGVGYAALSQQLAINGTANISASWDVKITNITTKSLVGAIVEAGYPTHSVTDASFDVNLEYPSASATFDITVENTGTIDAVLDSITGVTEANANIPLYISYATTGISEGSSLNAGAGPQTLTVTVTWDAAETTVPAGIITKAATIHLNYVQA
jgi:hypothetical protein